MNYEFRIMIYIMIELTFLKELMLIKQANQIKNCVIFPIINIF